MRPATVSFADNPIIVGDDWEAKFQFTEDAVKIVSSTNATPIVLTTSGPHTFQDGDLVAVQGHLLNTAANTTGATVANRTNTTLELQGVAGIGVGYATGTIAKVMDGTGFNLTCEIRDYAEKTGTAFLTIVPTWITQTQFYFKLVITDTVTAGLASYIGNKYHIAIKYDNGGDKHTFIKGEIQIQASGIV